MTATFVRYGTVGVANTALTFLAFALLTRAGMPASAASALGFGAGAVNGYLLNRAWTFRARGSLGRYVAVQAVGAVTSAAAVGVVATAVPRLAAEVLVIPAVTLLTFALVRRHVFTRSRSAPPAGA